MAEIAKQLENIIVDATSPDGNIRAQMRSLSRVSVVFRPQSLDSYTEDELSRQLSRLATATWAAYQRQYDEILTRSGLRPVHKASQVSDEAQRAFIEARDNTEARGRSPRDVVKVSTVGMKRWSVRVKPGVLGRLSHDEIGSELLSAVAQAREDWSHRLGELRREHFHPAAQIANQRP